VNNIIKIAKVNFIYEKAKFSRIYYKDDYKGRIYATYTENDELLTPLDVFDSENEFNEFREINAKINAIINNPYGKKIIVFENEILNNETYQVYEVMVEEGIEYAQLFGSINPGY